MKVSTSNSIDDKGRAHNRTVVSVQQSRPAMDGEGVRIQRNIANRSLTPYDPFLLLDEIKSADEADYIGGFPEHPHRGFETVTYMLEGSMLHRDHMGNEGLITHGGVQWMTAGRGVLHSEMPQQASGKLHGFQLWLNLPSQYKMGEPSYQEFGAEQIPVLKVGNSSHVKVIAGHLKTGEGEISGPVTGIVTRPDYFDVALSAGENIKLPIALKKRTIIYVYVGSISIQGLSDSHNVVCQELALLSEGHHVEIASTEGSRFLLLAGEPINEPIVNWGPFVMNTMEEIDQAIQDYRHGRLV